MLDRLAHCRIGRSRAFGAHVALGRKTSHQVCPRGIHRDQRAMRHALFHRLQILRTRMEKQMHMHIDQPRHQRHVAEVDHLRAATRVAAHGDDVVAIDLHLARRNDLTRAHIQHPRRLDHHPLRRSLLRETRHTECRNHTDQPESFHDASSIHRARHIERNQGDHMATRKKSSHTLSTDERNEMSDSTYAFPKERKEPLNNASHVRNAIARFDQVKGVSAAEKKAAFARIKSAAKKFGVDMSSTSSSELAKKGPAKKSAKKTAKKAAKKSAK